MATRKKPADAAATTESPEEGTPAVSEAEGTQPGNEGTDASDAVAKPENDPNSPVEIADGFEHKPEMQPAQEETNPKNLPTGDEAHQPGVEEVEDALLASKAAQAEEDGKDAVYTEGDAPEEDDEYHARRESDAEAMLKLEELAENHPKLFSKLASLFGVQHAGPNDAILPDATVAPDYAKVGSLAVNPYQVSNVTSLDEVAKAVSTKDRKVKKEDIQAWTVRGGMPDENQIVDDPNVYYSVVLKTGEHVVAQKDA